MANTNQARKRARQALARNQHLSAQRSQYRTAIKRVRKFILAGDKAGAQEAFKKAQKEGMSEDEAKDGETQAQKLLDKFTKSLDAILDNKEKEIMTV